MPAEAPDSTFKDRVTALTYPVQELGGLVFAYLGPAPVPLLPRWDLLVWDNVVRDIGVSIIPCNWVQCMENSLDPVHTEWLHGRYMQYMRERRLTVGGSAVGVDPDQYERDLLKGNPEGQKPVIAGGFQAKSDDLPDHARIGFDVFEHGIIKRRMYADGSEDDPSWRIGHPILFPNILRVNTTMQFRVPMDDSHTFHIMYGAYYPGPDIQLEKQEEIPVYQIPTHDPQGRFIADFVMGQDAMAWATQGMRNGGIAERHLEKLGESDRGIILYRRLLTQQSKVAEDGGDPMNVFRDPAKNEIISLQAETDPFEAAKPENRARRRPGLSTGQSPYSPVIAQVEAAWEKKGPQETSVRPQTIG
jgi:5,5'-dehydrodivanillate O-demethylase